MKAESMIRKFDQLLVKSIKESYICQKCFNQSGDLFLTRLQELLLKSNNFNVN